MPSRLVVIAIIVFWLTSASWLVMREIMPLFRAGEPPAFFTDVVAEVRGSSITWRILHKGRDAGWGFSQVRPLSNSRSFELFSDLKFDDYKILAINLKRISSHYWIDRQGNLKKLAVKAKIATSDEIANPVEIRAEVQGAVKDGMFTPKILINGVETNLGPFHPKPVAVPAHGNVLNTMHLLDKIPRLWAGRIWKVPLLDPLGAVLPGGKMSTATLIAEVHDADLDWQGQKEPCFRIDYQEPGKKAIAHTWVRRGDGLVLQQEANHNEMGLVLVREVTK